MLGPLPERPTAVRAARTALEREILARRIPAGGRLPPERTLAADLGVNRTTLRAALRELEVSGLVQVRHGSGYAVRDFTATGGPDLVAPLLDLARETGSVATIAADLLFVRRHLAAAVLDAVRQRRPSAGAIDAIVAAIDAFETGSGSSTRELAELDLGVVRAIVAATGSVVLPLFLNPIARVLSDLPELARAMYADPAANVAAYRILALALAQPDGLDARSLALALEAMAERDRSTLARLGPTAPAATADARAARPKRASEREKKTRSR